MVESWQKLGWVREVPKHWRKMTIGFVITDWPGPYGDIQNV